MSASNRVDSDVVFTALVLCLQWDSLVVDLSSGEPWQRLGPWLLTDSVGLRAGRCNRSNG